MVDLNPSVRRKLEYRPAPTPREVAVSRLNQMVTGRLHNANTLNFKGGLVDQKQPVHSSLDALVSRHQNVDKVLFTAPSAPVAAIVAPSANRLFAAKNHQAEQHTAARNFIKTGLVAAAAGLGFLIGGPIGLLGGMAAGTALMALRRSSVTHAAAKMERLDAAATQDVFRAANLAAVLPGRGAEVLGANPFLKADAKSSARPGVFRRNGKTHALRSYPTLLLTSPTMGEARDGILLTPQRSNRFLVRPKAE